MLELLGEWPPLVIFVGSNDCNSQLWELHREVEDYLALSHRWRNYHLFVALSNIDSFTPGINWDIFPPIFHHVWICYLRIMQDSRENWELNQFECVTHTNATLTITADLSLGKDVGLFAERDQITSLRTVEPQEKGHQKTLASFWRGECGI